MTRGIVMKITKIRTPPPKNYPLYGICTYVYMYMYSSCEKTFPKLFTVHLSCSIGMVKDVNDKWIGKVNDVHIVHIVHIIHCTVI